jgi:hypothetical protein
VDRSKVKLTSIIMGNQQPSPTVAAPLMVEGRGDSSSKILLLFLLLLLKARTLDAVQRLDVGGPAL